MISCGGSALIAGDESMQAGMIEDAVRTYTAVLNDKNSSSEEKETARSRLSDCYARKGLADLDKGNTDSAIAYFEKSGNIIALTNLSEIYSSRGDREYQLKRYTDAIELFEKSAAAADKARIPRKDGLDEKTADSYFILGETEFTAHNFPAAKKYFEPLTKKFDSKKYSKFTDALLRMLIISDSENNDDASLQYIRNIRTSNPAYAFDADTKKIFSNLLSKLTFLYDARLARKDYKGAADIIEKASVLPGFDSPQQKKYRARIVFNQGRDQILDGKTDDGLQLFDKARENDATINTEINNFIKTDYLTVSKNLQKKKEYRAAVERLLSALSIFPGNKEILEKALSDAYYELGNSCFIKKDYKKALDAINKGLALNKKHRQLIALATRFDQTANAVKKLTKKEFPAVSTYIKEQSDIQADSGKITGPYAGKKIRWQLKILGTETIAGKSYGKFQFDSTVVYGLAAENLDPQSYSLGCGLNRNTMEAVIEGTIGNVEELQGGKYLVINVNRIQFVEILE